MWILTFRLASGEGLPVAEKVKCREDELQGAKEILAMKLEFFSGAPWVCIDIQRGR